jgi:uncharacterized membrane protein (DUF485 family)
MGTTTNDRAAPDADAFALRAIAQRRMRVSLSLMTVLLAFYFGFLFLVAFAKRWMAVEPIDGLSWALVLVAVVILAAWLLTWIYAWWADRFHDTACDRFAE